MSAVRTPTCNHSLRPGPKNSLTRATWRSFVIGLGLAALLALPVVSVLPSAAAAVHNAPTMAAAAIDVPVPSARASPVAGNAPAAARATFPTPLNGPSPGSGTASAMTYDAADGYVLLVTPNSTTTGNTTTRGPTLDTWTYSAGNWSRLSVAVAPPNRGFAAMTYDAKDGYALLFGGSHLGGAYGFLGYLADTWTYINGTWTNITGTAGTAPAPRAYAPMVWDASDGYAVLFGGCCGISGNFTDTWSFMGGNWSRVPTNQPPVGQGAMSYDAKDGFVLYFGGAYPTPGAGNSPETWKYLAGAWTNLTATVTGPPSPRAGAAAAYDPKAGSVLLFGGCCNPVSYKVNHWVMYGDLWKFSGSTWTYISNSTGIVNRTQALIAYDPAANGTLLTGGWNPTNGTLTDTWIILAGTGGAIPAATQAGPYLRVSPSFVTVGMPMTVATIGVLGGSATTYLYRGLPPGCPVATLREFTCTPTQAGSFELEVTVNSAGLGEASTRTVIEVTPAKVVSRGPPGSGSPLGGWLEWLATSYIGGLLVGAAVTLGVGTWLGRKGQDRTRARSELIAGLRSITPEDESGETNATPTRTT